MIQSRLSHLVPYDDFQGVTKWVRVGVGSKIYPPIKRTQKSPNRLDKSNNTEERGGPKNKPVPENNVGPENKVGPENQVGPKNQVGPAN